ncbi:MAG: hypothetical protein JSV63_03375 [Candidatus Aenigmatarchaeota archaeon]|nr:MAG: hypothetical protein JSV63_03375 [Candidatus Aenigmarchaeota archaeon]
MKFDLTNTAIIVLVAIVIVIPASLYAYYYIEQRQPPSISDYCGANGFREVFPCTDGSFQSIRDVYAEGFRIVKTDGSYIDCPFTLPQYQEGECRTYTTQQLCGGDDLCAIEGSCVSDLDCAGECADWACS